MTIAAKIDELFDKADEIMHSLPTSEDMGSFYELADTSSEMKREAWARGAEALLFLADLAPEPKKAYFQSWAADAYLALGELRLALTTKPKPNLGDRSSALTDMILSIKLELGGRVAGSDVSSLFGPHLTNFGRKNIVEITQYLDVQLQHLQSVGQRQLLKEWSKDAYSHPHGMSLFAGHASYVLVKSPEAYSFSRSPSAERFCATLMREAENTFREEREIPRVGEGWVAETALYYELKRALAGETVIQHGRPDWLGSQHLDVFLPARSVAVEYQGEQHDRPIAFFGGEEAFQKNVERDRRKLNKCKRHGIRIVYVRAGYSLTAVLEEIRSKSR